MKRATLSLLALLCVVPLGNTPAQAGDAQAPVALTVGEKIGKDCTRKGKKLFGKVKVVKDFADLKVKPVEHFPDLKVKLVESFPDECGKWKNVEAFPDFTIKYVEHFPDLEIQMVEHFPGLP